MSATRWVCRVGLLWALWLPAQGWAQAEEGARAPAAQQVEGARAPTTQQARSGDAQVDAALERFWHGEPKRAAEGFREALARHPHSADLWYNLGCAEAEVGRLGYALHAFEQALFLAPDHEDAAHNLQLVRAQAVQRALGQGGELRVALPGDDDLGAGLVTALSARTLRMIFGVSWALAFVCLALWRLSRQGGRRLAASFAAVIGLLVALGAGGLLWGQERLWSGAPAGVLLPELTRARLGPGAQYKPSLAMVGGVKVRVQGSEQGYAQVRLPDGSDGWVPQEAVAPLYDARHQPQ